MWMFGAFYVIYEIYEELIIYHHRKIYGEYLMLAFLILMGFIFLYKGKVRSIIFDKGEGTLTIKKRNTFCTNRSISTYWLEDITDIRAVHRGYKGPSINTSQYMIIIEFEKNKNENSDSESFYSSSDEELER